MKAPPQTTQRQETGRDPLAWITHGAMILILVTVVARSMMTEVVRDPFTVTPGGQAAPRGPGPTATLGLNVLCSIAAILVMLRRVMDRQYVLRWSWVFAPLLALATWAMLSVLWASDRFAALVGATNLLAMAAVLWSACQLVRSWTRLRLVGAVILGVLLVYLAAGLQYHYVEAAQLRQSWQHNRPQFLRERGWAEDSPQARQFEVRVISGDIITFSNSPNTYAAAVAMMVVIAIGLAIQHRSDRQHILWSAGIAAIVVPAAMGIYFARSRIAYLTPVLSVAVLAALGWPGVRQWLATHVRLAYKFSIAAFILAAAAVVGHGIVHNSLVEKSLTFRWYYWRGAARLVAEHPLLGVGWGGFGGAYTAVRLPQAPEEVKDPHNFIVRVAAELGMVGLLLLLAWMLRLWWELVRPILPPPQPGSSSSPGGPPVWGGPMRQIVLIALAAVALNGAISIDFGQANGDFFSQAAGAFTSDAEMYSGNAWVLLEILRRLGGAILLCTGMVLALALPRSAGPRDGRPAPWLLYAMLIAAGLFFVHNMIDFSMWEAGPMMLLTLVLGSALGIRQPSLAGRRKQPLASVLTLTVATLALLAMAGVWQRAASAEALARQGDQNLRSAAFYVAAERYAAAAREMPLNADYVFRAARAQSLAPIHNPVVVRQMIRQAIARDSSDGGYWQALAEYELRQRPPDKANVKEAYEQALALNPANVLLRLTYANVLEQQLDEKAEAAAQYRRALEYDDAFPEGEIKKLPPAHREEVEERLKQLPRVP